MIGSPLLPPPPLFHEAQEDEDGEDDDVETLVQRLRSAGMPPDVLKVALKVRPTWRLCSIATRCNTYMTC